MVDWLERLKNTREEKQLSIANVSGILRINECYIRAIEEKDYSKLPETVYAIGFIKNYASFLGIDAEKVVSQFKEEVGLIEDTPKKTEPKEFSPSDCCCFVKCRKYLEKIDSAVAGHLSILNLAYAILVIVIIAIIIDFL